MDAQERLQNRSDRFRKFRAKGQKLQEDLWRFLSEKPKRKDWRPMEDSCAHSTPGQHTLAVFANLGYARPVCETFSVFSDVLRFHNTFRLLTDASKSGRPPFLIAHFEYDELVGLNAVGASTAVRFAALMPKNEDVFLGGSFEVFRHASQQAR